MGCRGKAPPCSHKLAAEQFLSDMGLIMSKNIANFIVSSLYHEKLVPVPFKSMVSMVSRSGRHLQRYDEGCRQVVGCIPYRYKKTDEFSSVEELEVLVISSQKGQGLMFPKGGWEVDESMEDAALRETLEEAGVRGIVERRLGKWRYKSKRGGKLHEGYMFPMLVQEQLDQWPEKDLRKRRWMSVAQAREVCQHLWMKEALDELVRRQTHLKQDEEKDETICCK